MVVAESPFVSGCIAIAVNAGGVFEHWQALVRRVVRVYAVSICNWMPVDRNRLGLHIRQ